jgi:hypothetical protein
MPSATQKRKGRGAEPSAIRRAIKTLDSKGRQTVSLKPRVLGKADQPPHFGSVGARPSPVRDDVAEAAKSAHKAAQFERSEKTRRSGGRAVVKV